MGTSLIRETNPNPNFQVRQDNGCMMVVPREFDPNYGTRKTDWTRYMAFG